MNRSRREAIHRRFEIEVHDVQSFLQTFDEELGLTGLAGVQTRVVVGSADFTITPDLHDGLHRLNHLVRSDAREPQRVIPGRGVVRRNDAVRSGRKFQCRTDVVNAETRSRRRGVLGKDHHAEELVEEPDVAGDHHQRGNRRDVQTERLILAGIDHLKVNALHLNVELRHLELRRQLSGGGDLAVQHGGLRELLFELSGGNQFDRVRELRRDNRKQNRDSFAVQHKRRLELDDAEVRFINEDPLLDDLLVSQRT